MQYNLFMKNVNPPTSHRQRQALVTQRIILEAARKLFLEQGYGTTTIEAISAEAGVAVSTVYGIYKNKRGILKSIREAWHQESGQREIYEQALQEMNPQRRMELAAHATRRQYETGAAMMSIYNSAAEVDLEAAAERDEAFAGRRANLSHFIGESKSMLNPNLSPQKVTAIYLALTRSEVYQELVEVFAWSPDDYEKWLAETLKQQLLP
ncbi:MAG: helix-turn-helix domain-containing protein [Chloroflexota bacterium]